MQRDLFSGVARVGYDVTSRWNHAMRMTPLFNESDTYIDVIDIAVYVAMAVACCLFLVEGGFAGLAGGAVGAVVGWRRPLNPMRPFRSMFKASIAGLWGGIMIGGMFATAIAL